MIVEQRSLFINARAECEYIDVQYLRYLAKFRYAGTSSVINLIYWSLVLNTCTSSYVLVYDMIYESVYLVPQRKYFFFLVPVR